MRKLIAAINMTLDGFCDHTAMRPDDAQMEHYNELYRNADTELFGGGLPTSQKHRQSRKATW